jgi:hypothetical protein
MGWILILIISSAIATGCIAFWQAQVAISQSYKPEAVPWSVGAHSMFGIVASVLSAAFFIAAAIVGSN